MNARQVMLLALVALLLAAACAPPATASPTQQANTPVPSATPDPYAEYSVAYLASRFYGAGEITMHQVMATTPAFTRYLISYPSDDLTIYGFMNVPNNPVGRLPVIVAIHGYIDPAQYGTLDYTTHYADRLAEAGYVVLHPNLRGYHPSDSGPNRFRVGMAIDVLNLIGIVQQTGGLNGALAAADPGRIGVWGHSMGGGISLRTITVSPAVDAAVLYGSMSGDEAANFTAIMGWSGGQRGREELSLPPEVLARISPINHLERITAAVSIHHGGSDELVPLAWSEDLCARLTALAKPVECFTYEGQPHTFWGEGDALFIQRTIAFFDRVLKG